MVVSHGSIAHREVDPNAPLVERDLVVPAGMQSLLAAMEWGHGAPQLTLIKPDGTAITQQNAAAQAAYAKGTAGEPGSTLLIVQNPTPGTWKLRISNATAEDYYRVVTLLNENLPTLQNLKIGASTATSSNTPGAALVPLTWDAPAAGSTIGISLYYTRTSTLGRIENGMIAENLDAASGAYQWDVSYLGEGSYEVWAAVRDGVKPFVPGVGEPRVFGTTQLKAQGTLTLTDPTRPPAPTNLTLSAMDGDLLACWTPANVPDLAGYVLKYSWSDPLAAIPLPVIRSLRVTAQEPNILNGKQCVRIGGFLPGQSTQVRIAAYDANNNLSIDSANSTITLPIIWRHTITPSELAVHVDGSGSATISWKAGLLDNDFLLHITGPGGDNGQPVASPRKVIGKNISISDLRGGCRYTFAVQTHTGEGRLSKLSQPVSVILTNGLDANSDGIPDDWMACYGLKDARADDDGDGAINLEEYQAGTDPQLSDSDGDSYSDGQEISCKSNPRDRLSRCADGNGQTILAMQPTMSANPDRLRLVVYKGRGPQQHTITIASSPTLTPRASSDAAWLSALAGNGTVQLTIDPATLTAGKTYSAHVMVLAPNGSATSPASLSIPVDILVYQRLPKVPLYLPLVAR